MLTALKEILESSGGPAPEEEILSFSDYLELVKTEPWITRNTFQLLHDMLLSSGVERTIVPGKPIKHRYEFFEDDALVGMFVVFGQQKAKANLVEKIDNASRGLEASKRLWILLGPPGRHQDQDGSQYLFALGRRKDVYVAPSYGGRWTSVSEKKRSSKKTASIICKRPSSNVRFRWFLKASGPPSWVR